MTYKKKASGIDDHVLRKKNGVLATPLNDALRKTLKLSSWAKERMPEYLWLGLILHYYGRDTGFEKVRIILLEMSRNIESLLYPRLSLILDLPVDNQRIIYKVICEHVEKKVLAPLTLLYKSRFYPTFNEFFFITHLSVEERISNLSEAIILYAPHQSNEATDLRFLVSSLLLFKGKISFVKGTEISARAIQEYPYTDHEDEKMRLYRPVIRSMEGGMTMDEYNKEFSSRFWRDIGMITPCNPMKIEFEENTSDYSEFVPDCRKILEYIFYSNKEKSLAEDRFDVIIGSINYAVKIWEEINDQALGNSILGRHGIRTIIEIYIMLKYLLKKESEQPKIWEEYKLYGISKYKLILLKAREYDFSDTTSHFRTPIVDFLVNELMSEEFIDVDLRYFDRQGIREKSDEAGEKQLYDLFYDYDSNFSHGLWGAVRESAMLHCDNPDHQYHIIPDLYANQKLPDVKSDSIKVMKMLYALLDELFDIPLWFKDKYILMK
jgi:hypothetical protein